MVSVTCSLPPSKCDPSRLAESNMAESLSHCSHALAKSSRARVESVVAYPQSSAWNQNWANVICPTGRFSLPTSDRTGGLSPGRTFGPVVATTGLGETLGGGVVDGGGEAVGATETDRESDGRGDALLEQPTASTVIRAISTSLRKRTAGLCHVRGAARSVVHNPPEP